MSNLNVKDISAAKSALLRDKRNKSEIAYAKAVGAKASKAEIAFAGTNMHTSSVRGAIANVACASGPGLYDYSDIAKQGEINLSDMSNSNLDYVANNFAFRADLVGLALAYDPQAQTVRVRYATAEEKADAIRQAASLTGRSFATVAAVTGFVRKEGKAPRKGAKGASAAPKGAEEAA
jgi:hypothetical protein